MLRQQHIFSKKEKIYAKYGKQFFDNKENILYRVQDYINYVYGMEKMDVDTVSALKCIQKLAVLFM